MSELPNGWTASTLIDAGSWGSGGTPKKSNEDHYENGTIPWLVIGDLNDGYVREAKSKITEKGLKNSSAKLVPAGTLLIAMYGSIGKLGITEIECATNQAIASCQVDEDLFNKKYLFYFLLASRERLFSLGKGGAQQNISQTVLKEFPVAIAPLKEQIRIADKLDSLLAKVDEAQARLEKIPTLLKRFRQSVLAAATSGELTREWREENSNSDEIWDITNIGVLIKTGPQNGIYKPATLYGKGTKIVRIDGFYDGKMKSWQYLKRVEISESEKFTWGLREGDVLINRVNSIEYLGKCGLVEEIPEPTVFESNIMRISLNERVLPKYLIIFLISPIGRLRITENAKHAVNQASINQTDVKGCKIELPCIDEQKEIVRRVESLFAQADAVEKQYLAAKQRLDRLSQALLAKAFRGELVPQDPNDEPAAELLKRIQAERDAQAPSKRQRKPA